MYEDITFDIILKRMLDRVAVNAKSQGFSIDTREGSIIYNSLAPVAIELQNAYLELDNILNESFADTQSREYLIKRCAERGINVKEATKAIRRGVFNIDVPIGSRFSLNLLNYVVIEKITDGEFKLECETPGTEGNVESGELIAIDYIEGLTSARLIDVLITPGEDEEDTEHLRERYFTSLDSQAFGGNVSDYKAKTNSLDGVGGVKVYPAWDGGGTVKLVIINSEHDVPSASLIYSVQEAIDPMQNRGQGVGIAPIGHEVSVFGCEGTTIDISTTIEFRSGWDWDSVKPYVETTIDEYFKELSANWDSSENLVVRISQLEARLLSVAGIHDIKNTELNNVAENFTLGSDNIPIRGAVSNVV